MEAVSKTASPWLKSVDRLADTSSGVAELAALAAPSVAALALAVSKPPMSKI